MKRKRDPAFLQMAAIAGIGGLLAIGCAIGMPIWAKLHGQPYMPEFSLFAAWGIAALGGAYACINTYFVSDSTSQPPPRGGIALVRPLRPQTTAPPSRTQEPPEERRAA